jgi:hypothetical protein
MVLQHFASPNGTYPLAIQLDFFCRFGNNLYQLAFALLTCEYLQVRHVFVPADFLFFNRTFNTTEGIRIYVGVSSWFSDTIYDSFFYVDRRNHCMNFDVMRIVGSFRSEFHRQLGDVSLPPNALYLHLRGGDVFQTIPSPYYAQPPCQYYAQAAQLHVNISQIVLVSEDTKNPCVREMFQLGGTLYIDSLFQTVQTLINAEGFVLSRSTFSFAAAFLSKYAGIGRFYTFAYIWPDIGPHWNCVPTEKFSQEVIWQWFQSPKQVEMIMTDTCKSWHYVKWGFLVNPYHGEGDTPFHIGKSFTRTT